MVGGVAGVFVEGEGRRDARKAGRDLAERLSGR